MTHLKQVKLNQISVNTESEAFLSKAISALSLRKKDQDLLSEKDVMALLPTPFGKSLVFQVFPLVKLMDLVSSNGCSLVIVSHMKTYTNGYPSDQQNAQLVNG